MRASTPGFVLLVRDRKDSDPAMRVGFTVTKKIGGAVVRNRMKRRFRALAREIVPGQGLRRRRPCDDRPRQGRRARLRPAPLGARRRARQAAQAMIAQADDPDRQGLAEGPVADPSAELPLPAELLGLCDHRNRTLWGRARRLDGPEAHLPLPPLGRPRPRPRTVRIEASERQQESDPRGGAERARAARLDVGREQIFPDRQSAEHQGRERQAAAAARSRRRSRRAGRRRRRCRRVSAVLGVDAARRASARPSLQGSINLKGAQIDDLLLVHAARRRSPRIRRRCACCRRSARRAPISPQFGWTGEGAQAPDARHGVDRRQRAADARSSGDADARKCPTARATRSRSRSTTAICSPSSRASLNASGKPLAVRPIGLVSRGRQVADPRRWTNHVGPIGVFDGKADYDVNWKDLDEKRQPDVRQRQRLARLHRQILADRAGARRQCRMSADFRSSRRAAATRPIMRSRRRSSRPARR